MSQEMVNLFVGIVTKYLGTSQAVKCCETLQKVQHRRGKNKAFVPYATFDYKSKLDKHMLYTGDKLMKIFIGAKILWAKQALLPAAGKKIFKFSIMIWINFLGKMLIWSLFCGIMELLLNNYLGHFLNIEKTLAFLFIESAIKATPLLHANFQMPWHTECNWLNLQQPECFYEPESPVTTLKSCWLKLPIHNRGLIEKNNLAVNNVNTPTTRYVLGYYTLYNYVDSGVNSILTC